MNPASWREMVDRTRELEAALGSSRKEVAENEEETVVIQRRCIRAARELPAGTVLSRSDLVLLRPAPRWAIQPWDLDQVVGRRVVKVLGEHDCVRWSHLE